MASMKLFHTIPDKRPDIPMLGSVNSPHDLRSLAQDQLRKVADELREYLPLFGRYFRRTFWSGAWGSGTDSSTALLFRYSI